MNTTRWSQILAVAGLALAAAAAPARAQTCQFSESTPGTGTSATSTQLQTSGSVTVTTPSTFTTTYYMDVGVWVDDELLAAGSNVPQKVLTYFEHANCIYGAGLNASDGSGTHNVSLRIANNRIRHFSRTAPAVTGSRFWIQQTHREFRDAIAALGANAPKVNVLFSGAKYSDIKWSDDGQSWNWINVGGASNGIGQGQAIAGVAVDENYQNTTEKPNNEDWWGVIAAHELGHATGSGHLGEYFSTMCCSDQIPDYPAALKGTYPSNGFGVAEVTWTNTLTLDLSIGDAYKDPYSTTPDPYTNETWSYPQIHNFLVPYQLIPTVKVYTGTPCSGSSCPGWTSIDDDPGIAQVVANLGLVYKIRTDGAIYAYTNTPCSLFDCPGWKNIDNYSHSKALALQGGTLFQLHDTGAIYRYTSPGWQQVDNNPATTAIAAGPAGMFQLHSDGTVWKFTGTACSGGACPGWTLLGGGAESLAVGNDVYQLRASGAIYQYTAGSWRKLDANGHTIAITASGADLYQLHDTGAIWKYTGTPCTSTSCPGWKKLDTNANTVGIVAGGADLFQLHSTGAIWRYTGTPCSGTSCPGWQKLETSGAEGIVAGPGLLQLR